jgi:ribonuclease D
MIEVKLKGRSSMSQDNKLWEKRPLSEDILKYASIDVLALFKLYDALCYRVVDKTRYDSLLPAVEHLIPHLT